MANQISNAKILFCGLPYSGKTTFLGALSYLANYDEIEKDFELVGLPEQRQFFNQLASDWVGCAQMSRTSVSSADKIVMTLKKGDHQVDVDMPDLSGETWQRIWTEHEIDQNLLAELKDSPHIILFIHADAILPPMYLDDEQEILSPTETHVINDIAPWNPYEHTPTQAIVVDLLHKISSYVLKQNSGRKLAIVLSAWDTVESDIDPAAFVQKEMPLLHQYLACKFDFEIVKIFGVSAQGGDVSKQIIKDGLQKIDKPSERIKVVCEQEQHSDLTRILSWLLGK